MFWTKEEVQQWILACAAHYGLAEVQVENFALNGRALCVLTRSDFLARCPSAGDVLYNTLLSYVATGAFPSYSSSAYWSLLPRIIPKSSLFPSQLHDLDSNCSSSAPSSPASDTPFAVPSSNEPAKSSKTSFRYVEKHGAPAGDCRLLWEFIHFLLEHPHGKYETMIRWKNRSSQVFQIIDPHNVAVLWGVQKRHAAMNFEKMARALRYYYKMDILRKEPGERHCYRFLRPLHELRNSRCASYENGSRNKV